MIFVKAGLYPNYLTSSKQKTWYHKLLLIAEFEYCGIQDGSVGFRGFGGSDIPQPTVGLPHFYVMSIGPPVLAVSTNKKKIHGGGVKGRFNRPVELGDLKK